MTIGCVLKEEFYSLRKKRFSQSPATTPSPASRRSKKRKVSNARSSISSSVAGKSVNAPASPLVNELGETAPLTTAFIGSPDGSLPLYRLIDKSRVRNKAIGLSFKNNSSITTNNENSNGAGRDAEDCVLTNYLYYQREGNESLQNSTIPPSNVGDAHVDVNQPPVSPRNSEPVILPESAGDRESSGHLRPTISAFRQVAYDKNVLQRLTLADSSELDAVVESELVIDHPNKVYHLPLAPFEVYSAGPLASLAHQRVVMAATGNPRRNYSEADSHEYIGRKNVEHIDPSNVVHVARPNSSIFDCLVDEVLGDIEVGILAKVILQNGEPSREDGRSPDSIRWHIAAAGQGYVAGSNRPKSDVGFRCNFEESQSTTRKQEVLSMIGRITSFVWECLQAFQIRSGQPQLGMHESRREFSEIIKKFLHIPDSQGMGFESITMHRGPGQLFY
eukprot:scaffold3148_cov95-Cylindrotheca_fusiformis.AAC.1